jgi:F-type H+-transporting ATPase subunit gamma
VETLEGLAAALETTSDIGSIVRTMKALSSVSIRQYEHAERAMADYARTVELGLVALLRQPGAHEAIGGDGASAGTAGRRALFVIGSDRGLCGGYNERILRFARARMRDEPPLLGLVGARIAARLAPETAYAAPVPPLGRAPRVHGLPGSVDGLPALVRAMILDIDRWVREAGVTRVDLAYNRREGQVAARPQLATLLPLGREEVERLRDAPWPGRSLPFARMETGALASWLVQQRIFVMIYKALAEALVSEHSSRLAAMQGAEREISERRDLLMRRHRQLRQEAITRELLDVVSGFEAAGSAGAPGRARPAGGDGA